MSNRTKVYNVNIAAGEKIKFGGGKGFRKGDSLELSEDRLSTSPIAEMIADGRLTLDSSAKPAPESKAKEPVEAPKVETPKVEAKPVPKKKEAAPKTEKKVSDK